MQHFDRSAFIKEKAFELGFLLCGIAKAGFLDEESVHLRQWLDQNHHGEMHYLANRFDKRVDPTKLVPNAKSVISLAYNYYNPTQQADPGAPKVSMYAYGRDYHKVVRKKLNLLFDIIKAEFGNIKGRVFVDSAPVMERDWAKRSGVGWIGKNTLLIHPQKGSFFFLAEMILDFDLEYDHPISDYCGTCTRCIDACPTDAIDAEGYLMDGSKCISYLTIELKEDIPEAFKDKMDNWMFGCDICQQVCPWNKFSIPHTETEFMPKNELLALTKQDWQKMTQETFDVLFEGSAVKRTEYKGLKRNINFLNEEGSDH